MNSVFICIYGKVRPFEDRKSKKYLVETAKDVAFYSVFYFWSADLSNYVPKHSMDFSAWQEHKHNNSVNQEDTTTQQTQLTEEVMVRKTASVLQSNSLV